MLMDTRTYLLERVEAFLAETGMLQTKFGAACLNDPALVTDLRAGREMRSRNVKRVLDYIDGYQSSLDDGGRDA